MSSVLVRHLNSDATFLLIFHHLENPTPADLTSANGAFTVLIDPFLTGSSVVLAPWFAKTTHSEVPAVQHLSDIEEPDVIVISQNNPDHCHKETLLQLNPEGKTIFATEPGAARTIKSWNYFDPNRIHGLDKYKPKEKFGNSLRLRIPPLSSTGHAGEVNISFIPAKNYMTGLHNAFGITYRAPTRTRTVASVSTIDLPKKIPYFHMPLSPATLPPSSPPAPPSPWMIRPQSSSNSTRVHSLASSLASMQSMTSEDMDAVVIGPYQHRPALSRSSNTASSEFLSLAPQTPLNQHRPVNTVPSPAPGNRERLSVPFTFETDPEAFHFTQTLPTPPDSPESPLSESPSNFAESQTFSHHKTISSVSSAPSTVIPGRPKTLSVLYCPHGLPLSDLKPYIQNHLVNNSALPLTLLLHGFDHVQNPWYLGGNVMAGASSGVQIARALMARCWVCAHDEGKDDRGVAVCKLKTNKVTAEEIRRQLWKGEEGDWYKKKGWNCDIRSLANGGEMFIGPSRDLLSGMEGKRESRLLKFSPAPG